MNTLTCQKMLHRLGYDPGFCDGIPGPKTRSAFRTYMIDRLNKDWVDFNWLPDTEIDLATYRPYSLGSIEGQYGKFDHEDTADGWIRQDLKWQSRNLRDLLTPWGRCRVHKKELGRFIMLTHALLKHDYPIKEFLTWQTRHKGLAPLRGLSTHCWGIAVDVNPRTNAVGTKGDISNEVVQTFEKFGFVWGGNWETPDPMHFQLCTRY